MEKYAFWLTVIGISVAILLVIVLLLYFKIQLLEAKNNMLNKDIEALEHNIHEDLEATKTDMNVRDGIFEDYINRTNATLGKTISSVGTIVNGFGIRLKRVEQRVGTLKVKGIDLEEKPDTSSTQKETICDNPEFDTNDPEYSAAIKPKSNKDTLVNSDERL